MYRAVELYAELPSFCVEIFLLKDFRMTRLTFGVSASSFAANMSLDHAHEYPLAVKAVEESFYVDDALTGANSREEAVQLQSQLQELFSRGGFILRKWNSNDSSVLDHISSELRDCQETHSIHDADQQTKTLGFVRSDHFHLTVASLPSIDCITKRALVSDISKNL